MKIIFVYNAEAGLLSGMMDSLHKAISPETYECALCALTHGFLTMDKSWRTYLKSLPFEAVFYHRKEFRAAYPSSRHALPAILLDKEGELHQLVPADLINTLDDINALCRTLDEALEQVVTGSEES